MHESFVRRFTLQSSDANMSFVAKMTESFDKLLMRFKWTICYLMLPLLQWVSTSSNYPKFRLGNNLITCNITLHCNERWPISIGALWHRFSSVYQMFLKVCWTLKRRYPEKVYFHDLSQSCFMRAEFYHFLLGTNQTVPRRVCLRPKPSEWHGELTAQCVIIFHLINCARE